MTYNDPLSQIITTLLKPLTFASKDNFAHLSAVKDVEVFVENICQKAMSISIADSDIKKINELQNIFYGFDNQILDDKKERIKRALEIIDGLKVKGDLTPDTFDHAPDLGKIKEGLSRLSTPITRVKGIGPKLAEVFKKKGLETVEDVLYWLPIRYEDRRQIKKIAQLRPGTKDVASGEIMAMGEVFYGRRRVFEISIGDGSGFLRLKWFNYRLQLMKKRYQAGERLVVYGDIAMFNGQKEIIHPDVEAFEKGDEMDSINFNSIVPVYSQIGNMHQKTIRRIIRSIVDEFAPHAISAVPSNILKRYGLLDLPLAIEKVHKATQLEARSQESGVRSQNSKPITPNSSNGLPRKSLVFDELFCLEMGLALKKDNAGMESGIAFKVTEGSGLESGKVENLRKLLPFKLTKAQEKVISEINKDMAMPNPMNRLIQGDVGSGKTIVAFIASLIAIENQYQSSIMAPTEILAEQHYLNIHKYAEDLGIRVALLTSSLAKTERKAILDRTKGGDIDLVIGTHALIQGDVEFKKLGLVIVDEQHRFGVIQRAMLKNKGAALTPDVLVMTATPIPRTLAMTVFGDLDVSVIDELPPGRRPIKTKVFREKDRGQVYKIIKDELTKGRQAYIVYPLIEESAELDLKDATRMAEHLQKDAFHEYKIGLLHGKMKSDEKEHIMKAFKAREIDILVSTTVIEVGIDVPNAAVMAIEHAERFGLSQLHQLRGRVGRGEHDSYCILLAGRIGSLDTYQRLKVMENTNDGFRIAEEDLKIRGAGDFLGTRQHGLPDFRIANLLTDASILQKAREEAFDIIKKDPGLKMPEHAALKEIIRSRWKERMALAEIG